MTVTASAAGGATLPPDTGFVWSFTGRPPFTSGSVVTTSFPSPGTYSVAARFTYVSSLAERVSTPIVVGPKPPKGQHGIVLARGARYTNRRTVMLTTVWPSGATSMNVAQPANPGKRRPVATAKTLQLTGSGLTKAPTTVNVEFDWPVPAKTYSDDIVLDLEKPKVKTAVLRKGKLRTTITEKVSGVATIQTANSRTKPAKTKTYRATLKIKKATWVRVTDRAGNRSSWTRVKHR